jgi:Family of unknown function (DUF5681)
MTFQQGESGNPAGRPRGARNKRTIAAENMFDREGADIIDRLIRLAKGGDIAAIRMCIDRICPKQRERPVALDLPPMTTPADAVAAMSAITQAVGDGDLGAQEAADLAKVIAGFAHTIATADQEARLSQLEQTVALLKRK